MFTLYAAPRNKTKQIHLQRANVYSMQCTSTKHHFQNSKLYAAEFQSPYHYMLCIALAMTTMSYSESMSKSLSSTRQLNPPELDGSPSYIKEVVIFLKLSCVIDMTLSSRFLELSLELFFLPIMKCCQWAKSRRDVYNTTIRIVVIIVAWLFKGKIICGGRDVRSCIIQSIAIT
jgi:hypothetical protein